MNSYLLSLKGLDVQTVFVQTIFFCVSKPYFSVRRIPSWNFLMGGAGGM